MNGQEDIDFCYRLGRGEYVFEYTASSVVMHHESRSSGRGRFVKNNRYLFVNRWNNMFPGDDVNFYNDDKIQGFILL